ncbi:MAG TPA: hypothetical protein VEL74_21335 [Thermoanaerobaculia bacterium]|nr:hypothetical protein [Thermoanaerobaculia bacterium]
MRADAARADRNAAIRGAARSWRRAGAIDGATLAAIEAEVPDDRVRVGPVFRVLLFVFTLIAITAAFGFVAMFFGADEEQGVGWLALFWGIALAVATEVQTGPLRRAQGGTEAGTSFAMLCFLQGGTAWLLFDFGNLTPDGGTLAFFFGLGAVLCAAAAWRWGFPLYAAAAMAWLLLALAVAPQGRLLWIAVPLALAPVLLRLSDSPRLPPAHRASCAAALVVGLAGLYLAVHYGSVESRWVEAMGGRVPLLEIPVGAVTEFLSRVGTALVPPAFLALGLWRRRRLLLLLGLAAGAASLATWYLQAAPAPLWVFLGVCGLVTLAAALAVRRLLDAAPDKERWGFTAEPLFDDPEAGERLEAAASVVTLTPEARAAQEPGFKGGGGEFGGGGASGSW